MSSKNCAVLIPYNAQKKVLLQLRSAYKERWANYWGSFGGGIAEDEDPEAGMKRELLEELGYRVRDPKFLYAQALGDGTKHIFTELFDGSQTLQLDLNESQKYGWFTLEEVRSVQIIPHDLEAVEKVIEYLNTQIMTGSI